MAAIAPEYLSASEVPHGTPLMVNSSGYRGKSIGSSGGFLTIEIEYFPDGHPVSAIGGAWRMEVPLRNVTFLGNENTELDERIILGRQYAFSKMKAKVTSKIFINPYDFITTLAVIFGNPTAPITKQRKITFDTKHGERTVPQSLAIRHLCNSLDGFYTDDSFTTFLRRLDDLQPWENNHQCILNITKVVLRAHGDQLLFIRS